jgi:hypothetical protein
VLLQCRFQIVVIYRLYKTVHRPSTGLLTAWPPLFNTRVYTMVVLTSL